LISKARQEIVTEFAKRELIQLIETIVVYKFPDKSRDEIEQMLGFSDLAPTHSTARDSSPWLTAQVLFRGLNACCILGKVLNRPVAKMVTSMAAI
jgi:hypothetical protein